jgi:hypothetical protein
MVFDVRRYLCFRRISDHERIALAVDTPDLENVSLSGTARVDSLDCVLDQDRSYRRMI